MKVTSTSSSTPARGHGVDVNYGMQSSLEMLTNAHVGIECLCLLMPEQNQEEEEGEDGARFNHFKASTYFEGL